MYFQNSSKNHGNARLALDFIRKDIRMEMGNKYNLRRISDELLNGDI